MAAVAAALIVTTMSLVLPPPHRAHGVAHRMPRIRMDAGKGFDKGVNAAAEERGRIALEAIRNAAAQEGVDTSLQTRSGSNDNETVEVPQEFKDKLVYGFAGFLIFGGVISLVAGGSFWEPKGFNEDGSAPSEQVASASQSQPAFGFDPTAREREQADEVIRPPPQ